MVKSLTRTERLLNLLQLFRRHRYPIAGKNLAKELNISLRTLYRDIAILNSQGAQIDGAAGLGYIMNPGFMLPPIMLQLEEIESLILGASWVEEKGDKRLAKAATNAIAKIIAVLPKDIKNDLETPSLLLAPQPLDISSEPVIDVTFVRDAIRRERKLTVTYIDLKNQSSQRTIWPLILGFFEKVQILVAWCELRQDFRHFRIDHLREIILQDERYQPRRSILLRKWRQLENIDQIEL